MNRGDKRWISIEVPTSKGINKFKKEIEPFVKLIGIMMVITKEWVAYDYDKIKISHKSDRQVSVKRLRELERENELIKKDQKISIHEINKLNDEAKTISANLGKLSERCSTLIEQNKNVFYNKFGRLRFPESFRTLLERNLGNGHGPSCRLVADSQTKQNYIDIGQTRMTITNWMEFLIFVAEINERYGIVRDIKNPFETK